MKKIHGIHVDNINWKAKEINFKKYSITRLINTKTNITYDIKNVIGLIQVSSDEFLVHKSLNENISYIVRYKLINHKLEIIFKNTSDNFIFIDDDRILFRLSRMGEYYCRGIYSIKENKMLEEAKWLEGKEVNVVEDEENKDVKTFVVEKLFSRLINGTRLIYTLDSNTLEINSDIYSELRDSYIKANNNEDLENVRKEELKYLNVLEGKELKRLLSK